MLFLIVCYNEKLYTCHKHEIEYKVLLQGTQKKSYTLFRLLKFNLPSKVTKVTPIIMTTHPTICRSVTASFSITPAAIRLIIGCKFIYVVMTVAPRSFKQCTYITYPMQEQKIDKNNIFNITLVEGT